MCHNLISQPFWYIFFGPTFFIKIQNSIHTLRRLDSFCTLHGSAFYCLFYAQLLLNLLCAVYLFVHGFLLRNLLIKPRTVPRIKCWIYIHILFACYTKQGTKKYCIVDDLAKLVTIIVTFNYLFIIAIHFCCSKHKQHITTSSPSKHSHSAPN